MYGNRNENKKQISPNLIFYVIEIFLAGVDSILGLSSRGTFCFDRRWLHFGCAQNPPWKKWVRLSKKSLLIEDVDLRYTVNEMEEVQLHTSIFEENLNWRN